MKTDCSMWTKSASLIILFLSSCRSIEAQPGSPKKHANSQSGGTNQQGLYYQTFGLPDPIQIKALQVVLQKYGVSQRSVAGCVVTGNLIERIKRNNDALFAMLDRRIGAGSQARVMAEVEAFARAQESIELILIMEPIIISKQNELNAASPRGFFSFNQIASEKNGKIEVAIDVTNFHDGKWITTHWRRFIVDTMSRTATQLK